MQPLNFSTRMQCQRYTYGVQSIAPVALSSKSMSETLYSSRTGSIWTGNVVVECCPYSLVLSLYVVDIREGRCSCPDYQRVGQFCKHMLAVRFSKHIAFAVDVFAQRTSQTAALFRWLTTGEGAARLSHKVIADVGIENECADDPMPTTTKEESPMSELVPTEDARFKKALCGVETDLTQLLQFVRDLGKSPSNGANSPA
jgi:hypothetical protein